MRLVCITRHSRHMNSLIWEADSLIWEADSLIWEGMGGDAGGSGVSARR